MFMFNKEEFKRLNAKRDEIIDNEFLLDIAWKNTISYVCQDKNTFEEFIEYIKTEMTGEEYINLSEISMDLSGITVSLEFADAFKSLAKKYPKETADYHIAEFIEDAEGMVNFFLEDEDARVRRLKEWYPYDPDFIEPYLTKKYT